MSIVSPYATPEAQAVLKRQRVWGAVSSFVIACLVVGLVGIILALILIPGLVFRLAPPVVAYTAEQPDEVVLERPETMPRVHRQPAAPSFAMSRVIASTTPTPTSVPVPEVEAREPSLDFGDGDDFGEGWGTGGGFGGGKGGTTFFGQSVRAERIAFVIDYSKSMKRKKDEKLGREGLMRTELSKSLHQLVPGTKFALIFFAGPAWTGGDEVIMKKGQREATVKGKGRRSFEWLSDGTAHGWKPAGKQQEVEWLESSKGQLSKSRRIVEETQLVWGTNWENPLRMALAMNPAPQVIYFMTDGTARGSKAWAREAGERAKKLGVTINCIAMMQPKAEEDLHDLAKRTKGQFTVVLKGGKRKRVR